MFMLHGDYLPFMPGCRGDDGGVTGENAAKPLTTARVYVSTFLSVNTLNIFDKQPQRSNICKRVRNISSLVCSKKNRHFKLHCFPHTAQVVFVYKQKIKHKETQSVNLSVAWQKRTLPTLILAIELYM